MNPKITQFLITTIQNERRKNNMRDIKLLVTHLIRYGAVLQIDKVRVGVGKKHVTVGPYQTATGTKMYAMYVGGDRYGYYFDDVAAGEFIAYVGRDRAREAVLNWYRNNV